jgi:uncharacterized membrane protein
MLPTKLMRTKVPALSLVAILLTVGFLIAPWSLETKAHAALHGLCSQRPSHSLELGGRLLPFDARMTGIYGGFLTTTLSLLAWGRFHAVRQPSRRVLSALVLFVVAMALDGTNSLLVDLGVWNLYPPTNAFRLATGLLTGTALATILCFVVATTLWRSGWEDRAPVTSLRELLVIALFHLPFVAIVLSGSSLLYTSAVLLLLAGATLAMATISGVVLVLLRHGDGQYTTMAEVETTAATALVLGVIVMVSAAVGRFAIESWLEIPPPV